MKYLLFILCAPVSWGLLAQDCELPAPYTNGSTGNNLTVLLDSTLLANLSFVSPNPYIVALTSSNLVVGSACLAPDCLINGMQSIAVWGDDTFTNDIIEGAENGENITLKIVDGIYLYELTNIFYTTNGIIPISLISMVYVCTGQIYGCIDSMACNYNSAATQDDGSCNYPELYYDCDANCLDDIDTDGICDALEIMGCVEPMACNYHATATDEGPCDYADMTSCEGCSGEVDGSGIIVNYDADDNGFCDSLGCADPTAMNFSPFATEDDGSCNYLHQSQLSLLQLAVYPNPIVDWMTLMSDQSYSSLELFVTNTLGALVYQKTIRNVVAKTPIEIDTQAIPSGIYFMRILSPSAQIFIPIIKK